MNALHTTLLTTEELTTASGRLSAIWTPLLTGQPALLAIASAADGHRAAIIAAAARHATGDFTTAIQAADAARDAAFTTLRDFIGTWAANPTATPAQLAAAARLVVVFTRHGNTLQRLSLTTQSARMDELIAELHGTGPTADLAALNLAPLAAAMVAAQTQFETVMAQKAAAEGGAPAPIASEHRPPLARQVNCLLQTIAEWQTVAPTPALNAAIALIDEVISDITAPALARRTKDQAEPPPAPAPAL